MKVMRRQFSTLTTVGAMVILISCSSPKYTYNFDYYDYNSGRKTLNNNANVSVTATNAEPLKIDKSELIAATGKATVTPSGVSTSTDAKGISTPAKAFKDLSKAEKKHLRSELRDFVKAYAKDRKSFNEVTSVHETKALDTDLKLAIIFGAIGITFSILGGINTAFWVIGVIALIVGLVFFIRWIVNQ
jgi:hypothetical protein